ncbi:hypothetical protein [uncultured Halorubrum sp.]|nr:hypothetical protein [uncultured Halorubrum sp.]
MPPIDCGGACLRAAALGGREEHARGSGERSESANREAGEA